MIRHFADFKNALRFLFPSDLSGKMIVRPLGFDTLNDREVIFHVAPPEDRQVISKPEHLRRFFAYSCVFQINDTTAIVTVPDTLDAGYYVFAWNWYKRLMEDFSFPHNMHRARLKDGKWQFDPRPMPIRPFASSADDKTQPF